MFTGIVEEVGRVGGVERTASSARLRIQAERVLDGTHIGDSIAVNGVCLTVTDLSSDGFCADAMPETLQRSTLGRLHPGDGVDLERALLPTTRIGGHIVSGHIDGVGRIRALREDDIARVFDIAAAPGILRYVVEKGSVAIDGVSLTVAGVRADSFSISVIPHTFDHTVLGVRTVGDELNIECDIIGKYVERLVSIGDGGAALSMARDGLSMEYLRENGF